MLLTGGSQGTSVPAVRLWSAMRTHPCATELDTPESTLAYRTLDAGRESCARRTLEAHAELVALWHRALTLHYHTAYGTFTGFSTMAFTGDPVDRATLNAWHARHALLGTAGRTSKLAMDAALTGYYSEAAALTRHVTEAWAQAAYLRVLPTEGLRWYRTTEGFLQAPPSPKTVMAKLRRVKVDRGAIDLAASLFEQTHKGAHPSREFLGQVRGRQEGPQRVLTYVPVFDDDYSRAVLEWGALAMLLALSEYAHVEPQPQEWHDEWADIEQGIKAQVRDG